MLEGELEMRRNEFSTSRDVSSLFMLHVEDGDKKKRASRFTARLQL
jgi:hypothetical protein